MDDNELVRRGYLYEVLNPEQAYQCFQLALSKAPDSIGGLEGASKTCDHKRDRGCRLPFLMQIGKLRPDYYEARIALASQIGADREAVDLRQILGENPPPPIQDTILNALLLAARSTGDVQNEVLYGTQLSEIDRRYFALYPTKYGRTSIVFRDEDIALRLEGLQKWTQAEEIYRRNLDLIRVDPLFEKATKFGNELGLARTLEAQGNHREAARICSHWRFWARFIGGRGEGFWGYGSRAVTRAEWDLSCGKEEEGLAILHKEATAHPWIFATHIALRDYSYAHGDVQNALRENGKVAEH